MRYSLDYTSKFKKDVKRCVRRGLDVSLLFDAIQELADTGSHSDLFG